MAVSGATKPAQGLEPVRCSEVRGVTLCQTSLEPDKGSFNYESSLRFFFKFHVNLRQYTLGMGFGFRLHLGIPQQRSSFNVAGAFFA